MPKAEFRVAKGAVRWALCKMGLAAVTMPWKVVYIHPQYKTHMGLIRHEMVHVEQIDRDGPWMFTIKYLGWLVLYGYRDNPYEVEAYGREPIHG